MLIFLTQTLALTLVSVTSWFTQLLRAFHVSSHLTSGKSRHILGIQYLILAQSVNELVSDLMNNDLPGYLWGLNEMSNIKHCTQPETPPQHTHKTQWESLFVLQSPLDSQRHTLSFQHNVSVSISSIQKVFLILVNFSPCPPRHLFRPRDDTGCACKLCG